MLLVPGDPKLDVVFGCDLGRVKQRELVRLITSALMLFVCGCQHAVLTPAWPSVCQGHLDILNVTHFLSIMSQKLEALNIFKKQMALKSAFFFSPPLVKNVCVPQEKFGI